MELSVRLAELQKRALEHREVLLTEEAAKTALVMPFLQSLGWDVFNPSEVVPEYTADVGTKKGEKVDYAICLGGKIAILVECKPASVELNINHAAQLFRYFSVTDARLALLTNGVQYQFYSDIERPNKMDDKPFFTFSMDFLKPNDAKTIESFAKAEFNIEKIVREAVSLKLQSTLRRELEKEFAQPSEDFIRLMAAHVYEGKLTSGLKDTIAKALPATISGFVRDLVNDRLASALNASNPPPSQPETATSAAPDPEELITTQEELAAFHIVQAIASRYVHPKRIVMRDAKSYCAILLDDNNRKSIARLHFNALTSKYLGTFTGRDEQKNLLAELTDIYRFEAQIVDRLKELEKAPAG